VTLLAARDRLHVARGALRIVEDQVGIAVERQSGLGRHDDQRQAVEQDGVQ